MNKTTDDLLVLKFGGTSMSTVNIIEYVAELIKKKEYGKVVIIVSAMGRTTDTLMSFISSLRQGTVHDKWVNICENFTLTTGENVSAGLLALALNNIGLKALPIAAWQVPVITSKPDVNNIAQIENIEVEKIHELLEDGVIPVITGFQGIYRDEKLGDCVTTLGRGGSDTSAVKIAHALKANKCQIYTDVPGIFTADPNIVSKAKVIEKVDYVMLEELAKSGAKIVHPEAAALANKYRIDLSIQSTFNPSEKGTKIVEKCERVICLTHMEVSCLETDNLSKDVLKKSIGQAGKDKVFLESEDLKSALSGQTHYKTSKAGKITIFHTEENFHPRDVLKAYDILLCKIAVGKCTLVVKQDDLKDILNVLHDIFY